MARPKSKKTKITTERAPPATIQTPAELSSLGSGQSGKGMIDITDLTGQVLYIGPSSIVQIYYANYRSPESGSIVICGGLMQATHERAEDLVARMRDRVRLVNLHIAPAGPTSFPVWISVDHIVGLKATPHGTIVWAGLKAPEVVVEDYPTVSAMIDTARAPVTS
jgi:hypothetical protein